MTINTDKSESSRDKQLQANRMRIYYFPFLLAFHMFPSSTNLSFEGSPPNKLQSRNFLYTGGKLLQSFNARCLHWSWLFSVSHLLNFYRVTLQENEPLSLPKVKIFLPNTFGKYKKFLLGLCLYGYCHFQMKTNIVLVKS